MSTSVGFPPWTSRGITIWWRLLVAEEHPLHTRLPHWTFPWVLVAEEHHPPFFFFPVTESRLGRTCERSQSLGWRARQEVLTESSPACRHRVGRGMGEGVSVGVNRGTRQVCRHTHVAQVDASSAPSVHSSKTPAGMAGWSQTRPRTPGCSGISLWDYRSKGSARAGPSWRLPGQRHLRGGEGGDRPWPPRGGRE